MLERGYGRKGGEARGGGVRTSVRRAVSSAAEARGLTCAPISTVSALSSLCVVTLSCLNLTLRARTCPDGKAAGGREVGRWGGGEAGRRRYLLGDSLKREAQLLQLGALSC